MTNVEKFVLAKCAAANLKRTALPGSQLASLLNWSSKMFKGVKKKPVLPPGKDKPSLGILKPKVQ